MTNTQCGGCGATVKDATLCSGCGDQLRDVLRALPGLVHDLEISATRQDLPADAATTYAGAVLLARPDKDLAALEEEHVHRSTALPAYLRSRMGRITLPTTALPVSLGAVELLRQARAGIANWLHLIKADPVPRPVVRRYLVIRHNRAQFVRTERRAATVKELGAWLAGHTQRIRVSEHGPEIHARALDLKAAIEATIDPPVEPVVFAGVCGTEGCGQPLIDDPGRDPDDQTVTCLRCGAEWEYGERRQAMEAQAADRLGTVREVAGFLRILELDVTVDKIDGWLRRGRITDHGNSARGRLVRIGEVREYAKQVAAKRVRIGA